MKANCMEKYIYRNDESDKSSTMKFQAKHFKVKSVRRYRAPNAIANKMKTRTPYIGPDREASSDAR